VNEETKKEFDQKVEVLVTSATFAYAVKLAAGATEMEAMQFAVRTTVKAIFDALESLSNEKASKEGE
jgi:hypothetical protein